MVNRKHTQIHMGALISILLLIGQFGVLSHSVEHPFHTQDQSCQIFLQCENSGNGLISPELQFPILVSHVLPILQIVSIWLSLPQSAYSARAPPPLL
ncbi:MAG: DUF2607 family protein [gamma proteobacterium endosymbiont of Lamellibrachia anaximandri]|nr:DUF2607 family protein [gamma proteobacterium endosymbiont of Lamellibrachia anaximandri]